MRSARKWLVLVSVLAVVAAACGDDEGGGETGGGAIEPPITYTEIGEGEGALELIAWHGYTEDGTTEGKITANTKYLVLGEYPNAATQVALQKPWEDMHREAQSLGVETITITDFLNQMGYRPQDRTVQLGAGASARDFPARPENGSGSSGTTRFRPRTPNRTQPAATE